MPAVLGGYLVAIVTLLFVAGPEIENYTIAVAALKILAGFRLAASLVDLWRNSECVTPTGAPVKPGSVFVTTLLNPKSFNLCVQRVRGSLLVALVSAFWIFPGALLTRSNGGVLTPTLISRIAAVVLATFGSALATSAIAVVV
jgi:hypothetical protein